MKQGPRYKTVIQALQQTAEALLVDIIYSHHHLQPDAIKNKRRALSKAAGIVLKAREAGRI